MQPSRRGKSQYDLPFKASEEQAPRRPSRVQTSQRARPATRPKRNQRPSIAMQPAHPPQNQNQSISMIRSRRRVSDSQEQLLVGLGIFFLTSMAFWLFVYPLF